MERKETNINNVKSCSTTELRENAGSSFMGYLVKILTITYDLNCNFEQTIF